jgi:folylpolyglutamate synthase/dihydropteroate synthase
VYGSIEGAIEEARQIARARYPQPFQVLITGSLHLAGGFLKVIGGNSAEEL